MRSEERAGIIAAVLTLLWGTVLSSPLHIFTVYLEGAVNGTFQSLFGGAPAIVRAAVVLLCLTGIEILLLLLSGTGYSYFIPVTALVFTAAAFCTELKMTGGFDGAAAALTVMLVITAVFHVLKFRKALLWEADIFIYSISVHAAAGLVFGPLSEAVPSVGRILYINRYDDSSIFDGFEGLLTLPPVIWGAFMFIIATLPVIYYTFSRRKE